MFPNPQTCKDVTCLETVINKNPEISAVIAAKDACQGVNNTSPFCLTALAKVKSVASK